MKNKSLFQRYFYICFTMILLSMFILGAIFLVFASQYFKEDKYTLLSQNLDQAADLTVDCMIQIGGVVHITSNVENYYNTIGESIGADIYLADMRDGRILYSGGAGGSEHQLEYVPMSVMESFRTKAVYTETGRMKGLYESAHYTVGKPILSPGNRVICAVFASTSASALSTFLVDIFQMFVLSAVVVMILASIIIYFVTSNMIRPLRQMLVATGRFARGDFSTRVPVEGDDEVSMLAAAFNAMASSLATLEQSRRSFTANVSHELKTPMTTIGGFIDGILDGTIPPEKQNYYLQIVSTEVKRLSRMVRAMLNLSRIEAGELKINPEPVEITDIVTRTTLMFEKPLTDKNIEVRGLDTEKRMVEADPDMIQQVVYNLIENAVKFVNPGGYLEFRYWEEGDRTLVAVRNSGEGIQSEELNRVFDRFYKSDKSRSKDKSGVGLGLYIVRTIINLHGGEIFIRSEVGQYTEFVFSLTTCPQKKQPRFRKAEKENLPSQKSE